MPSGLKLEEHKRSKLVDSLPVELANQDMRRKRPPLLSFLLRAETLRTLARIIVLLTADFVSIFVAIFTALSLKAAVLEKFDLELALDQTKDIVSFVYLLTVLLFARSHLYSERAQRPGLTRITASLFQVMIIALIYALANHVQFTSYYIFYGGLIFSIFYISIARALYERASGFLLRKAGYR